MAKEVKEVKNMIPNFKKMYDYVLRDEMFSFG